MLNFPLPQNGSLSSLMLKKEIYDFKSAIAYVNQLPYGRTSDRTNFHLIVFENKGTCSTKHAFLKQLAVESQKENVKLFIGIYQMNEANTKGVGKVLDNYNLAYIPEAHIYLKINGNLLDVTRTTKNETSFEDSLLIEQEILPPQIGSYKVDFHQNFLKQWIADEQISYSFEEIWNIREKCIFAISE
ncbi:hypothetical protein U8527_15285 [Kordia algicida OT-1]|uniref:Uncharacterized protein n=1 Tax=Kordia algicida OT-1 TaxID=391587 RepID=A9E7P6_9FLAO|nr:hypothetical protein [Kordia algicida]EDP94919.1 hypothetical protein KAOT1_08899 [Kordia algicida OT-1]